MEKRLLLSFALSILVLFVFGWFYSAPLEPVDETVATPPAGTEPVAASPIEAGAPPVENAAAPQPAPAGAGEAEAAVSITGAESIQAEEARTATLETALVSLRFNSAGGVLESARLLRFTNDSGEPLELIDSADAAVTGWPLAIVTGDPATDATIGEALFVVEEGQGEIRMEYAAGGLSVVKEFRAVPGSYRVDLEVAVRRDGAPLPFSLVWQGGFGERYGSSGVPFAGRRAGTSVIYRDGAAFERLASGDIEDPAAVPATDYAGVTDRYFLAMFLLPDARPPRVGVAQVDAGDDETTAAPRLEVPYVSGPVGLYIGPQQEQALTEVDARLASVIDYGFFGVLSRPMMFGLVLIHDTVVANWGWSIIVLTLFINFVFFPLRLKQQLSMQKMQRIQPQMRTLQDKYKKLKPNDPRRQEVQTEMMGLYKKHGVNPLGGCLPLLLQMPFLIAVFGLLQVAIELRQAPWIFWIQDLAAPDPYYVLPVVFGVSMFVQQKMMPTTVDPTQARIMMIMPVFLTVMFIGSQSGLMLYWLTSNLFGVGQQFLIRTYWAPADREKRDARGKGPKAEEAAAMEIAAAELPQEPQEAGRPDSTGRRRRRRKK